MKSIILFSISLFIGISLLAQEGATFKVEVSTDSVLLGNYIEVTFTLENANMEDFQAPTFEGFQIISGPNQSSSFSMVNGKVSQQASYSYYLEPKDIGNYYIPPASVSTGEQVLETMPIEIMVVPNPDGIIQQPKSKRNSFGNDFFDRNDLFSRDFFGTPPSQQAPRKKAKKKRKTYKL